MAGQPASGTNRTHCTDPYITYMEKKSGWLLAWWFTNKSMSMEYHSRLNRSLCYSYGKKSGWFLAWWFTNKSVSMECHSRLNIRTKHQNIVDAPAELLTDPAWRSNRQADVHMFLCVPGITSKEQLHGELRYLTFAVIADRCPRNVSTHVYTDESADVGMKNGGSRVYIRYPDGDTTSLSVPGGLQCSSYQSEILAICTAAEHLLKSGGNK